ncbi:hypothetical protein [Kibdelosporangium aridum]|uniref:hypothetical protein n=1 Tax=Kibdelosporangium aridum TaxID=2030 RepID=UPI0009FBC41B|nr:hypothetical protein [Kibdelosporangium aridum]
MLINVPLCALAYGFAHDPAMLAIGVAALGVFVVVEAKSAAVPLLPLRLLRSPATSSSCSRELVSIPTWYFLTLTMHNLVSTRLC